MSKFLRMNGTHLQVIRLSLGLTVKAFGDIVGKYERSIREYEARKYEPSAEVTAVAQNALADMAAHLKPYLDLRNGAGAPRVLTLYPSVEDLHDALPEFKTWSLEQYKAFLSHLVAILTAKNIEFIVVTPAHDE